MSIKQNKLLSEIDTFEVIYSDFDLFENYFVFEFATN